MKSFVIVGTSMPDKIKEKISAYANDMIVLPEWDMLDKGISSHPDTLLFYDGKSLFCGREYLEKYGSIFSEKGIDVIPCVTPKSPYPDEAVLNGFVVMGKNGTVLIGRQKSLAPEIRERYPLSVDVRQGYAHCATALVCDNVVITCDKGIAEAVESVGGCALTVRQGFVQLTGYEYGFIGGASALCAGKLLFFGCAEKHPDFAEMKLFADRFGVELCSLSDDGLFDAGGAVFV